MRILFVTASYLPTINGVSYHIKHIKQELEKQGHKVFVLAPSFPNYQDTEKEIIRYPSLPNPFIKKYPVGLPLISYDKIKKLKPQIIHTHHPLIIGRYAALLAEKLSLPLFFSAHTQYEQYLNYYFPQGYQITSSVIRHDLISLAQKCRVVICPSPETKKRLEQYGINNTKIIFNGVDTSLFNYSKPNLSKLTVVYTGRIEKEKNPEFLLKVAKEINRLTGNFEMLIIGGGRLLPGLSSRIIKYGLEGVVRLTGELPQNILPKLLGTASIFFTPSKSEVMPLSVIEALSCGLPAIVLKEANLDAIITHNKNGLILSQNSKIIAQEILALFNDKKRMLKYSLLSRRKAEDLSIEKCVNNLLQLYQNPVAN